MDETLSIDTLSLEEVFRGERAAEITRLNSLSKKVCYLHTDLLYYRNAKSKMGASCYEVWKTLVKRVGGTSNCWRDLGHLLGVTQDDLDFSAAAATVFLAWFELLLLLQRFDQIGLYVVMFLEILQTLMRVLSVFSILIIAFGLAFYILLSKGNHVAFKTILISFMRMFAMMLGEIDFVGTYVTPLYKKSSETFLLYPITTFLILALFMVLIPVLLMNLLIGLAVGDIESVRRNAQLKRLAMQVVLHTELERKLPAMLLEKVDKTELIEYPNSQSSQLGFFDIILRKWFCNPFTDDKGLDMMLENNEDYVTIEMEKQKRQIRDMSQLLEQQHKMLRLIVQKMDIKTEADEEDEGESLFDQRYNPERNSPRIRRKLRTANSINKGV